ncbi:YidC/Oxa1 family membrane protein insertase [Chitinophaga skermanii]|uniref:Membrane protein insertase YidC n=1 Tax=Chitinophaga skermanii TaxID=331697 RepID=A0A327Q4T6_9BACT|nr:membrane protein insertase YidC [Chitinophaga skermanii]RAI99439.1 YidC/Oxa1 family membrane protein insertase [Chitinophaga skermanii]
MDRNTIIGLVCIIGLAVGYFFYQSNQQQTAQLEKQRQDSIANLNKPKEQIAPVATLPSGGIDSTKLNSEYGAFAAAATGTEQTQVLENDDLKITFSNKGGAPASVELKKYKTYDKKPLFLEQGSFNRMGLKIPVNNSSLNTADLYFTLSNASDKSITYRLNTIDPSKYIEYVYTITPGSYMVNFTINAVGMQNLIAGNTLPFQWNLQFDKQEQDINNERMNNQVHYRYANEKHDYFTLSSKNHEKLEDRVNWVSVKQQFFNVTMVAKKENFASADINTKIPESGNIVGQAMTTLNLPYDHSAAYSFPMDIYYGPNHFKTLKSFGIDLESIIPLGSGIFFFVKYINKWIIIPVFNFLSGFISNFGVIIILLTVFIRLLISPFTYQSYVSAAKMKVLKPEIDALRAKFGDDQQGFGMEQMKLFRSAGVNPLGGCLPALLQLPILVAMYSFFPSSIELRQESFLWATDLSTYDSIYNFGFNVPFYGNHISLFTILMTITSLILAFYNRGMTDQSNPVMKYMPFVFPIMLLGIFNKLAAALTFYYFLSNVISILLQWVIQKFVINHDKIHLQIQENKKKGPKKSKWSERLEEMQKRQQEMQEQAKKGKK